MLLCRDHPNILRPKFLCIFVIVGTFGPHKKQTHTHTRTDRFEVNDGLEH